VLKWAIVVSMLFCTLPTSPLAAIEKVKKLEQKLKKPKRLSQKKIKSHIKKRSKKTHILFGIKKVRKKHLSHSSENRKNEL
jgi:hypothetical protein